MCQTKCPHTYQKNCFIAIYIYPFDKISLYKEGVLLIVIMEKGEINLSKYLEVRKTLTVAHCLYIWEEVLFCLSAIHDRSDNFRER